ncbi:hypothetical protein AB0C07_27080 [Actinoplanes missouriensis]|uniref:hypothetical protein n=1 Tax=Actinoplanes missouriensis TaxID=1866 RepID=UPI0033D8F589
MTIGNRTLRLTPGQAAELLGRIDRVLADYPADRPGEPAPTDSGKVVFPWQSCPQVR